MSERSRDPRIGFTSELGLSLDVEDGVLVGHATVEPELCIPEAGVLRPSVLLTWADVVAGSLANEYTLPQVCMTVDLDVHVLRPFPVGTEIRVVGSILKSGRTVTFGQAVFAVAGDDEPAAIAVGTFVASPRPDDVAISVMAGGDDAPNRQVTPPPAPVRELLGSRVIAPGIVEAERHRRILNWADTVQGGAVAVLAEEAVLSLDGAPVPSDLQVRYTNAVRVGPMRATAERLGRWVRVEVVDTGSSDRLVAVAMASGA